MFVKRDSIKGDSVMVKKKSILSLIVITVILAVNLNGQDIHAAARKGDLEAVKAFVETDPAQIKALNASGSTPLIVAASNGHMQVVVFLLEKGADIQAANKWGRTALHYAVDGGNLEVAKLLLEKGADINGHKDFPLHTSSYRCEKRI